MKFTFQTRKERWDYEGGLAETYDIVRIKCYWVSGNMVDFPCKSREEYEEDVKRMEADPRVKSWEAYQDKHHCEQKLIFDLDTLFG